MCSSMLSSYFKFNSYQNLLNFSSAANTKLPLKEWRGVRGKTGYWLLAVAATIAQSSSGTWTSVNVLTLLTRKVKFLVSFGIRNTRKLFLLMDSQITLCKSGNILPRPRCVVFVLIFFYGSLLLLSSFVIGCRIDRSWWAYPSSGNVTWRDGCNERRSWWNSAAVELFSDWPEQKERNSWP